jgi:uncharacterized iron-regulated membrane protein
MILLARLSLIHRWVGLVAVSLILLQIGTGMMLIYRADLDRLLDPQGMIRKTVSADVDLSRIIDSVKRRRAHLQIQRIFYPDQPNATFFVRTVDAEGDIHFFSVDPGNAQILREGELWDYPVQVALRFHFEPLPGRSGSFLVCVIGVLLLLMNLTGVYGWWHRRGGAARNLFNIRWHMPPVILVRQLHRTLGVWITPFLMMIAVTGLILSAEIFLSQPLPVVEADNHFTDGADQAIAVASDIFQSAPIRDVRFTGQNLIKVQFHARDTGAYAVHQVVMSLQNNSVVSITSADQNAALWPVLLPLHTGAIFGSVGNLLIFFIAVLLMLICSFGLILGVRHHRLPR